MLRFLRQNLLEKLFSLAIAIVILVFVNSETPAPESRVETTADVVPFGEPPSGLIVKVNKDPIPVALVGPRHEVDAIKPLAIKVRIDRSMAKPDSSQLPVVGVTRLPFAPNVVVRLMRNVVTADIAREKRRGLQIDEPSVTNPAPPGQTYGKPRLTPSAADVVGPESEVRRVARLVVYIATEAGNVRTEVPIRALDGRGVVMDSVRVEPPTTRAVADLVEAPMARDIVVSVRHTGRPASGYEVREILVDPASVTAVGKMAVVQALTNLQTEEINLEGVRADAVRSAALQLPAGVEVRGGIDRVRVTVKVRELPRPAP